MIIAIILYGMAHFGVVSASPVAINALAAGAVLENYQSYLRGRDSLYHEYIHKKNQEADL